MNERRVRLRVHGRVQGVGFRYFVRARARALGVRGWVRNMADGAVELAAAGSEAAMTELEGAVRAGPPGARVDRLEMLAAPDDELPLPFTITH